jgi:hypothetical protein
LENFIAVLTVAKAVLGLRVAATPAGVALIVDAAVVACGARIPEPAMAAADSLGGRASIPVGVVVTEPAVLGRAVLLLGPTVDQIPVDATGEVVEIVAFYCRVNIIFKVAGLCPPFRQLSLMLWQVPFSLLPFFSSSWISFIVMAFFGPAPVTTLTAFAQTT